MNILILQSADTIRGVASEDMSALFDVSQTVDNPQRILTPPMLATPEVTLNAEHSITLLVRAILHQFFGGLVTYDVLEGHHWIKVVYFQVVVHFRSIHHGPRGVLSVLSQEHVCGLIGMQVSGDEVHILKKNVRVMGDEHHRNRVIVVRLYILQQSPSILVQLKPMRQHWICYENND